MSGSPGGLKRRGGPAGIDGGDSGLFAGATGTGIVIVISGVGDTRQIGANELPYGDSDGTITCTSLELTGAPTLFTVAIGSNEGAAPFNGTIHVTADSTAATGVSIGLVGGSKVGLGWFGDSNTYIERSAADTIAVVAGGANAITCTATAVTLVSPLSLSAGTVGAPALNFGDADTGLYSNAAGNILFSSNGALQCYVVPGEFHSSATLYVDKAAASGPALSVGHSTGYVSFETITAGTAVARFNDAGVGTTTWTAGVPSTDPAVYLPVRVGATTYRIPCFT